MSASRKSLEQFAKTYAPGRKGSVAWLETIPEYPEVVKAYKRGMSISLIAAWLAAPPPDGCGYPKEEANRNRVGRHLRKWVSRD